MNDYSHRLTPFVIFVATLLILSAAIPTRAQIQFQKAQIGETITCHISDESYVLHPDKQHMPRPQIQFMPAFNIIQSFLDLVSQHTKLRIQVDIVPVTEKINVQICPGDHNYIAFYYPWLDQLYSETKSNWALYGIFAHEIGHYALNHDRTSLGSQPRIELEADEFAGLILAEMGASLEEAQTAYRSNTMWINEVVTQNPSHPPIAQRLAAVEKGWRKGNGTSSPPPAPRPQISFAEISLQIIISGIRNTVYIVPASTSPSSGQMTVSGIDQNATFYLEIGKACDVNLSGVNNRLIISAEIKEQVRVERSGVNNQTIIK
ncbi:MAG TPA: hypothetical protein DC054_09620 [Blastocatellia bacterium]|nr:hypothetical protein [Blastocatellia bacterium]